MHIPRAFRGRLSATSMTIECLSREIRAYDLNACMSDKDLEWQILRYRCEEINWRVLC